MYYRLIRACPVGWIVGTFGLSFGLFVVALFHQDLPSFDDPLVGFEVRQSELSSRLNTWKLLIESTAWNGLLSLYPLKPEEPKAHKIIEKRATNQKKNKHSKKQKKLHKSAAKNDSSMPDTSSPVFSGREHSIKDRHGFCGKLFEDYVHFVVESTDGSSMLEMDNLHTLCRLDRTILRSDSTFKSFCEIKNKKECCPSWSLPNFIAVATNRTDCESISRPDVDSFVERLNNCSMFYINRQLHEDCTPGACQGVPEQCLTPDNGIYFSLHFLVDYRFLDLDQLVHRGQYELFKPVQKTHLRSTSIFLPMAKSSKLMPYYDAITGSTLKFWSSKPSIEMNRVRIIAADLGLKHTLFSRVLLTDLMLLFVATGVIFCSLLAYTRSFWLTATAMLTNVASLASAYFVYCVLFNIEFFPFLNLLTLIILIGIGSDNALIYCKAWSTVKHSSQLSTSTVFATDASNRVERKSAQTEFDEQMDGALLHVLVSCLCASLTTCGAFFAGYFSEITSLKCFSIFAGTSIMTNFLITIATFPSAILLSESLQPSFIVRFNNLKLLSRLKSATDSFSNHFFNDIILRIVFNYRHYVLPIFGGIALLSGYLIFFSPGLQLPSNAEFQVFSSGHLFEQYDLKYRQEFWFSRILTSADTANAGAGNLTANDLAVRDTGVHLPIRIVFGILPIDNGNTLNPFDRGQIGFDRNLNISSHESQIWLLEFCRELRVQPFRNDHTLAPLLMNCFIDTFKDWMEKQKCIEYIGNNVVDRFPCCRESKFPYEPTVFDKCLVQFIERIHHTPDYMFAMSRAGPRFNSSGNGKVEAIVIEYDSIFRAHGNSFEDSSRIWTIIDSWVREQIAGAPDGLKNGWFVTSNMELFALQYSLSEGIVSSILISVSFAFASLVLTTLNVQLSIISIVSISALIFNTIAGLILLDWKLNVVESVTISLTIGLAIDATLHYSIAYKLLVKDNRLLAIQMTLARIGSPVAMGAATTFLAGAVMLASSILAYIQIGTFMMILATVSWIYSTLFHMSLLAVFAKNLEQEDCSKLFDTCKQFWTRRFSSSSRVADKNAVGDAYVLQKFEDGSIFDLHQAPPTGISMHPGRLSDDHNLADDIISRRSLTLSAASSHSCLRVTSI